MEKEHGVAWQGKQNASRLVVQGTGFTPSFVHFVSVAHWPHWDGYEATMPLQDAFRRVYPAEAKRLLDSWNVEAHLGSTHTIKIYDGEGFWFGMRLVLCTQCRLLGSTVNECREFPSLIHWRCAAPTTFVVVVLTSLIVVFRKRCCPKSTATPVFR